VISYCTRRAAKETSTAGAQGGAKIRVVYHRKVSKEELLE